VIQICTGFFLLLTDESLHKKLCAAKISFCIVLTGMAVATWKMQRQSRYQRSIKDQRGAFELPLEY
jgi:hypothetical protein